MTAAGIKAGVFNGSSNRDRGGPRSTPAKRTQQARISFLSYNIGGMATDSYDAFASWLQEQTHAQVVVLQEIHWGLGKEDTSFQIGSWHIMTCVDANNRFAGVAVCVSSKLASVSDLRFATIVPGDSCMYDGCDMISALTLLACTNGLGIRSMFL